MEFCWLSGSLCMPREERNNKPLHMYGILCDFFLKNAFTYTMSLMLHFIPGKQLFVLLKV